MQKISSMWLLFQNLGKFKDAAIAYEALTKLEPQNEFYYLEDCNTFVN
jgi:hypothetical protein